MTTTPRTTTQTPLTAIEPRHMEAAHRLAEQDPATLAVIKASVRQQVRKITDLDREEVASLAVIFAPLLAEGAEPTAAAAVAVRRAARLMRLDEANQPESLDAITDERGEPLARPVSPWTPDPAAPASTTDADRLADALADLDDTSRTALRAAYGAEWKGGKVPAAAIRRALDLPPVTGRAGTAWTAEATRLVTDALAVGRDAAPDVLTCHWQGTEPQHTTGTHGAPRRRRTVDASAARTHAEQVPGIVRRYKTGTSRKVGTVGTRRPENDTRRTLDNRGSSGPASHPVTVNRRTLDRLGIVIDGRRQRADVEAMRDAAHRLAVALPTVLDPWTPPTVERPSAAAVIDGLADAVPDEGSAFDPMNTGTDRTGQRLPGVSTDEHGVAVARSGNGAGMTGSSTGSAVQTARPSRRAKGGSTGPTVPVGGRGSSSAAPVASITGGKPSAAGMGTHGTCSCTDPRATFCTFHAVALVATPDTHRLDPEA